MRGAILLMAVLSTVILATAATTLAQAETPQPIRAFRPMPPTRVAVPFTPRPATPPSVMPRTAMPMARTPHCPKPPIVKPLPVSIPKAPNYNRRTMALIQQNIVMMSVMRNTQASVPRCKSSWSEAKLRRKGCPVAAPADSAPEILPARDLPRMQIAAGGEEVQATPAGASAEVRSEGREGSASQN
jgi:hypothetical protein